MNKNNLTSDMRNLIFKHDIFNFTVKNSVDETTLFFYGNLDFTETNYSKIKNQLTDALNQNKNITIRINSHNGSIIEGIAIYDLIKSFSNKVTVIVEGVVSDFTIPIALSGDKILMTENAFFNLESIKAYVQGSRDALESMRDKLITAENILFKIFQIRVKPDFHDEIKEHLNNRNGVWLDSVACEKINLCDEIISPIEKQLFEEDETVSARILTPENIDSIDISVSKFLEGKSDWNFKKWQENDSKGLEKLAMRFPITFNKLFKTEYPEQEIDIKINPNNQTNNNEMNTKNKENWTFKEWQKEDPAGLEALEKNSPEKFSNLFNQQFPIESKQPQQPDRKSEQPPQLLSFQKNWSLSNWLENDIEGLQALQKSHPDFVKKLSL